MSFILSRRTLLGFVLGALLVAAAPSGSRADDKFIIVQSTTSTQNSGLFDHILPIFTKKTGIEVRVVAVGTGQALKNAENGDGDVVLVHSKPDEEKFVADGWGVKRHDVMYNDFVIVGPAADPAKIAGRSRRRRGAEEDRRGRRRPLPRAATSRGRTRPNSSFGRTRVSIPSPRAAHGISRRAPAWAPPSTPPSASRPTR